VILHNVTALSAANGNIGVAIVSTKEMEARIVLPERL